MDYNFAFDIIFDWTKTTGGRIRKQFFGNLIVHAENWLPVNFVC